MHGTCMGALRQGAELVGYSDVYAHQQGQKTELSPKQPCEGEASYEQHGKLESAARRQRPEQHVEEQRAQGYVTAHFEQPKQRYSATETLQRQLEQYASVSAVLQQRLVEIEIVRSRLLERLQLDRILRSKEAATKAEALDRRIQQHESEAGRRKERNSYIREDVFQILHWRLTKKKMSDALTRFQQQQNKFYREITPYVKADVLARLAKQPSSLPGSPAGAHEKLPSSTCSGGPGGFENATAHAGKAIVESGYPIRNVLKKGATQNGSYSNMPLAGGTCSRERRDMESKTLLPATGEPASDQGLPQEKRPLVRWFASTGFLENEHSRTDVNRNCHPQAPGRHVTYNSTVAADPFSSFHSPQVLSSGPSQMLRGFMHSRESVVPALKTLEHSFNSREPLHLQLLALRYKQEMTALELLHVSHSRPPVPRTSRCQEGCVRPSRFIESVSLFRSNSSATAPSSSLRTASSHFNSLRNTDDDGSPRTQGSTCSKGVSPVTATERTRGSRIATTNVSITSAGAACPPGSPGCLDTLGTVQRVPVSASLSTQEYIDGASSAVPVELCSAPILLSSDTSCPPAIVSPSGSLYRTRGLRSTKNAIASENATDRRAAEDTVQARSAKHEGATKTGERLAVDVPSSALPVSKRGTGTTIAIKEGTTRPYRSSAEPPSKKGCSDAYEPNIISSARQISEQDASVDNQVTYKWMSPEIPTEAALEQHTSKANECPTSCDDAEATATSTARQRQNSSQ